MRFANDSQLKKTKFLQNKSRWFRAGNDESSLGTTD